MNDDSCLELEQYFDDELPADRHAACARLVSEDHEAHVYLDRLAGLRALARRYDRGCSATIPLPSRSQRLRPWAIRAAGLAACIAVLVVWRNDPTTEAPGDPSLMVVAGPIQVPLSYKTFTQTQEVAIYTWANTAKRRPQLAACVLLSARTRFGKRRVAVEILALELANATTELAEKLEPLALLHKPAPRGRSRNEWHGRQIRSVLPGA